MFLCQQIAQSRNRRSPFVGDISEREAASPERRCFSNLPPADPTNGFPQVSRLLSGDCTEGPCAWCFGVIRASAKSISPLARNTASWYFSATAAAVFNARPGLPFARGEARIEVIE